jgi:hypothetical protein
MMKTEEKEEMEAVAGPTFVDFLPGVDPQPYISIANLCNLSFLSELNQDNTM